MKKLPAIALGTWSWGSGMAEIARIEWLADETEVDNKGSWENPMA